MTDTDRPRFIRPTMRVEDARYLEGVLTERLDTMANWLESQAISGESDAVVELARQRAMVRDIRTGLRHQLRAIDSEEVAP
jgi:hypothetical protein